MRKQWIEIWYKSKIDFREEAKLEDFGTGNYYICGYSEISEKTILGSWEEFERAFAEKYLEASKNGGLDLHLSFIGGPRREIELIKERINSLYEKLNKRN